ncbi:hypothetical protein [uncultured Aquimarina sp.]|uniref:hypothetical protein n=1 Tax=uncultured Aquimarina sp. TaxID=575652 RepID=UPI002638BA29|nr:hypothetical protein [uncultured Aquimarina sp.]
MDYEIPKLKLLLESDHFRTRIAMYIGEKKLSTLKGFLDGIYYAFDAYGIKEENVFEGLHKWTADYYGWTESTAGWKNIILKECGNNELKAVDEFFKVYDEFKKTSG